MTPKLSQASTCATHNGSWNNNVPSLKLMSELQQSAKTGMANKVTSNEAFCKN